jgi:hypothetical protein
MQPIELARILRAADAGDPRAGAVVRSLESRAGQGDAWAHRLLFQARALVEQSMHAPKGVRGLSSFFSSSSFGGGDGISGMPADSVRTEQKAGGATIITIATPSAGANFVAYVLGAATIICGILFGIMLPGIIRRQGVK